MKRGNIICFCSGGQRQQKNSVELSIREDIERMSSFILKKKQLRKDAASRKEIDSMEAHLKIIKQSVGRVSAAAESFGVLQIECKIKKSISAVMKHIAENLRFNFEKNKCELEELKSLLREYQLMENDGSISNDVTTSFKHRNFSTSAVTLNNSFHLAEGHHSDLDTVQLEKKDASNNLFEITEETIEDIDDVDAINETASGSKKISPSIENSMDNESIQSSSLHLVFDWTEFCETFRLLVSLLLFSGAILVLYVTYSE